MRVPTKREMLADPSTPRWAKDLLEVSGRIDPVDYLNVLEVLLAEAKQRIPDDNRYGGRSSLPCWRPY